MGFRHSLDASSLREYDIRGIVGKTLSVADAFAIGRTFASMLARNGGKTIVVGLDGRLTSPELEEAVVKGALASGANVTRVGRGPTPMIYFAAITLKADGAIMVTGSHNPPAYNGFKMMENGQSFFGDQIRELGALAAAGDVVPQGRGSLRTIDVTNEYVARLLQDYDQGERRLKVVWDSGNSAAGEVLTKLVAKLPGEHILLNAEIDGRFPAHHPDPTIPENLVQLQKTVRDQKADLGIAFDGDADRIGIVDNQGEILWADQILIVLAREILKDRPGATVIADTKASQTLFDEIEKSGGTPLMWKTGHSLMKSKMVETHAPLAGEMSGHIFFADKWYGFDDALYAAVRFLSILSRISIPLSSVREQLPYMTSTPELRFECDDVRKFEVVEEVAKRLRKAGADVSEVDGVRVRTPDGWWLLRASNTQPALVARVEGQDSAALHRLIAALVAQLELSKVAAPDFSKAGV
ncbi:phosphoglucomutase/phosphomannomutase PgmG [Kozakia baliensis]|uniref:phosphoglucomutase/phosphomannomutase PgmG n=1 Tax=Kozakia baliensis TaxID=153496 RepID=UPI00345BD8D4